MGPTRHSTDLGPSALQSPRADTSDPAYGFTIATDLYKFCSIAVRPASPDLHFHQRLCRRLGGLDAHTGPQASSEVMWRIRRRLSLNFCEGVGSDTHPGVFHLSPYMITLHLLLSDPLTSWDARSALPGAAYWFQPSLLDHLRLDLCPACTLDLPWLGSWPCCFLSAPLLIDHPNSALPACRYTPAPVPIPLVLEDGGGPQPAVCSPWTIS